MHQNIHIRHSTQGGNWIVVLQNTALQEDVVHAGINQRCLKLGLCVLQLHIPENALMIGLFQDCPHLRRKLLFFQGSISQALYLMGVSQL